MKNPSAFKPKRRGKDRRVTLDAEGRKEHTRLFHRKPTGKVANSVWKSNSLWNKKHEAETRKGTA